MTHWKQQVEKMILSDLEKHEEYSPSPVATVRCSLVSSRTSVNSWPMSCYLLGFTLCSNVWQSMDFQATDKSNSLLPTVLWIWSHQCLIPEGRQTSFQITAEVHIRWCAQEYFKNKCISYIGTESRHFFNKNRQLWWRKNQSSTNNSFSRKSRIWILDTFGFKTFFFNMVNYLYLNYLN